MSAGLSAMLVFTCIVVCCTCVYGIGFMVTVMYRLKKLDDGLSISKNKEVNGQFIKVWLAIVIPALLFALLSLILR